MHILGASIFFSRTDGSVCYKEQEHAIVNTSPGSPPYQELRNPQQRVSAGSYFYPASCPLINVEIKLRLLRDAGFRR